jgi:hypothetical protein
MDGVNLLNILLYACFMVLFTGSSVFLWRGFEDRGFGLRSTLVVFLLWGAFLRLWMGPELMRLLNQPL